MAVENLITEHIDIWTSAVKTKSTSGRGSSNKLELYGVKKLRELILELAVRGKLVPQDPNDEPASVLLERIAQEKAQLVKEKKIKKPRKYEPIDDNSLPFNIPSSWKWARIEDLGHDLGQKKPDKTFTYVDVGSINKELGYIDEPSILEHSEAPSRARKLVQKNTVIYSTVRPYLLNIAVIDRDFNPEPIASTAFAIIHPLSGISSSYIYRYLRSPSFIEYVESVQTGIAYPAINDKQFFFGLIPVPPSAEQHRIVAKVDELMALCDQLEQQTEASIEAHQVLVTTLLDTLTHSADADELMQNWARISEHFDTLFTTEESIDQLKQTILQLAVMGKLVPQDPTDEPVSNLLERIKNHQLDRVQRKEIQKPKKASVSTTLKMDIPKCWKSLLLNDLVFVTKLAGFEYTKYINLEDAGDVAVIRAQNVRPFKPDLENLKFIDNETSLSLPRSAIDRPSLLVTFIGAGIGDVCVFNEEKRWHLAPNVAKIEPYADLNLEYLCIYLNSPVGRGELFKSMKSTAQPSLSMTTIREIWVALPPVDEQKRIVTEVNRLFTLCDQLAVRLKASQVVQLHLTNVIAEQAI